MQPNIKGRGAAPAEMSKHLKQQRRNAQVEVPPLIRVITWVCFFRFVAFMAMAMVLGFAPQSKGAVLVETYFSPKLQYISSEVFFLIASIVYGLIGLAWLIREARVRWFTMFITGTTAAYTVVLLAVDRAFGTTTLLSEAQTLEMIASVLLNIFLCAYLAFYPGIGKAFGERA